MTDRCVMCGEIIPEGRQVCPECENKGCKNCKYSMPSCQEHFFYCCSIERNRNTENGFKRTQGIGCPYWQGKPQTTTPLKCKLRLLSHEQNKCQTKLNKNEYRLTPQSGAFFFYPKCREALSIFEKQIRQQGIYL